MTPEPEMKCLLMPFLALIATGAYAQTLPEMTSFSEQQIFENWVQNRCIGKIADSKSLKDDAMASAAAWLEASNQPAGNFEKQTRLLITYSTRSQAVPHQLVIRF